MLQPSCWRVLTVSSAVCSAPVYAGLAEGVSYIGVLATLLASAVCKARTGSGLPTGRPGYQLGPGALLGLAEGVAWLYGAAGAALGVAALALGGADAVLPERDEGICGAQAAVAKATPAAAINPCEYAPDICVR